eukprot:Opistho-2@34340
MAAAVISLAMTTPNGFLGTGSERSLTYDDDTEEDGRDPFMEYPIWPDGDLRLTWAEGCCPQFGNSNWAFQRQNRVVRSSNGSIALRKVCLGAIECTGEGCTVAIKPGLRKTTLLRRLLTRCRACGGRMVYKSCDAAVVFETYPPGACDGYPGGKLVMRHYGHHAHSRPTAKDHRLVDGDNDADSDAHTPPETTSPPEDKNAPLSRKKSSYVSPTGPIAVRPGGGTRKSTPSPRGRPSQGSDTKPRDIASTASSDVASLSQFSLPAPAQTIQETMPADTKNVGQLWEPIKMLASACAYVAVVQAEVTEGNLRAPGEAGGPTASQQAGEIIAQLRMGSAGIKRRTNDSESSDISSANTTASSDAQPTPKRGRGRPRTEGHTQGSARSPASPVSVATIQSSPTSVAQSVSIRSASTAMQEARTVGDDGTTTTTTTTRKRGRPKASVPRARTRCKTTPTPVSGVPPTGFTFTPSASVVSWNPSSIGGVGASSTSAGILFHNGVVMYGMPVPHVVSVHPHVPRVGHHHGGVVKEAQGEIGRVDPQM